MYLQKTFNKKKDKFFKQYIENPDKLDFLKSNYKVAIITPDKDIIPGVDTLNLHSLYLIIMKFFYIIVH